MNKELLLTAGAVLLIIGAFFAYRIRIASAPSLLTQGNAEAQSTTTVATTTAANPSQTTTPSPAPFSFTLAKGDTVASWDFQSAYTGNADLVQKAQIEIARLSGMLGSGKFTDYDLYVSIANEYDLLGDGTKEFTYLTKALTLDSTKTGLAWDNMGQLLSKLGANLTARIAFENAAHAQLAPQFAQDLVDFLKAHFPQDSAAIQKAQQDLQKAQVAPTL